MPIDKFTEREFRDALPIIARKLGVLGGEYCYLIPVFQRGQRPEDATAGIMVRSSVRPDGVAADTGKDSIRCWLVDTREFKPLAAKLQKYTTRIPGWKDRLLPQLRELYKIGLRLRICPACKKHQYIGQVKDKMKPSYGKYYIACPCSATFEWLDNGGGDIMNGGSGVKGKTSRTRNA